MNEVFKNKRIILGVSASIAAYKAPLIVRELIKLGAHVNVITTQAALNFVAKGALASVSKNPVVSEMFDENLQNGGAWHVQLAHWADMMIVAPCSATTMSKLATGLCDSALVTVALARPLSVPLLVAPAMDYTMWLNPATQRNLTTLKNDGAIIIPPNEGELASGLTGPGRLAEISQIIDAARAVFLNSSPIEAKTDATNKEKAYDVFAQSSETLAEAVSKDSFNAELELANLKTKLAGKDKPLAGKKILITAGPTKEKIDDVRYIINASTGKMGYAIANAAKSAGADVVLVSGPTNLTAPEGVEFISVESADEMWRESTAIFPTCSAAIMTAAVADFTLENPRDGKIKKSETGGKLVLELTPTKDILASLGAEKKSGQVLIGFALESNNELVYGLKKLNEKNCDMIILNSANKPDSGFGGDNNTITILSRNAASQAYAAMSKNACAQIIINKLAECFDSKKD